MDLWSDSSNENIVYGLKENSMRLFLDYQEAINAHNISPDESKFCYMEVKLTSDQEKFETKFPTIEHAASALLQEMDLIIFKLLKTDEDDGREWFDSGKKIEVNYNIPARTFWNGVPKHVRLCCME